jgi:hypothetical protein
VTLDATRLSGPYLHLDHYESLNPAAPQSVALLPGQHFLKTTGGDYLYFTVKTDGGVDYDASSDGVLAGRGTDQLAVLGRTITLDARQLSGSYLYLDHYQSLDPAAMQSVTLLPGEHFLRTLNGDFVHFTIQSDGRVDYDASLGGVLAGRGTDCLLVQGRSIVLDASALSGSVLYVDYYTSRDPSAPQTVNLLPGTHNVYTTLYGYIWFTVTADGVINYDASLDGIIAGRGTSRLTFKV